MLPAQFFDAPDRSYKEYGIAALMRAVLEDALACFLQQFVASGRHPRYLAREAEEWFFSDNTHWPFAFVTICAVLGLDPEYIRLGLKRRCLHYRAEPQTKNCARRRKIP